MPPLAGREGGQGAAPVVVVEVEITVEVAAGPLLTWSQPLCPPLGPAPSLSTLGLSRPCLAAPQEVPHGLERPGPMRPARQLGRTRHGRARRGRARQACAGRTRRHSLGTKVMHEVASGGKICPLLARQDARRRARPRLLDAKATARGARGRTRCRGRCEIVQKIIQVAASYPFHHRPLGAVFVANRHNPVPLMDLSMICACTVSCRGVQHEGCRR